MRVSIFFDGKHFYIGMKAHIQESGTVDYALLAQWLVQVVRGERLWGAHYYTGVETGSHAGSRGQVELTKFLQDLELVPGYIVRRFPRKSRSTECSICHGVTEFTAEKEVDTTLAIDMVRLAAVDGFDIAIIISGDADHAATAEAVRSLGKQVFVGTWGFEGLSPRLRHSVHDCIDLCQGVAHFARSWSDHLRTFVTELKKAERKFPTGYVGMSYFLNRWEAFDLVKGTIRTKLFDELVTGGKIERYVAPDGTVAIRSIGIEPRARPVSGTDTGELGTEKIKF